MTVYHVQRWLYPSNYILKWCDHSNCHSGWSWPVHCKQYNHLQKTRLCMWSDECFSSFQWFSWLLCGTCNRSPDSGGDLFERNGFCGQMNLHADICTLQIGAVQVSTYLCISVQWKFVWGKIKMWITFTYSRCTTGERYITLDKGFLLKYRLLQRP